LLATQLTETKGVEQMFELKVIERLNQLEGVFFEQGQIKDSLTKEEITLFLVGLEVLKSQLNYEYDSKYDARLKERN
jgi:hypothetical protein